MAKGLETLAKRLIARPALWTELRRSLAPTLQSEGITLTKSELVKLRAIIKGNAITLDMNRLLRNTYGQKVPKIWITCVLSGL